MRTIAFTYLAVLIVFTVVDLLWLGLVALGFYKKEIGALMRPKPRIGVAIVFYLLFAAGITLLAVQPAVAAGSWTRAASLGAVLGLSAYGAYDLTNLATLKDWSARLAAVDMVWGTFLVALSASAGFFVATKWAAIG